MGIRIKKNDYRYVLKKDKYGEKREIADGKKCG